MCASAVAAKDRRKRLSEGRHPYKEYVYDLCFLGKVGDTWEGRENLEVAATGGEAAAGSSGGELAGPGESADHVGLPLDPAIVHGDELVRYLADEAALGGCAGEGEDPFGVGSGFDAP